MNYKTYAIIITILFLLNISIGNTKVYIDTTFKEYLTNTQIKDSIIIKHISKYDNVNNDTICNQYLIVYKYDKMTSKYKKAFVDKEELYLVWPSNNFRFKIWKHPFNDSLKALLYYCYNGAERYMDYYLLAKTKKGLRIVLQNEGVVQGDIMQVDTFYVEYTECRSSIIYLKGKIFMRKYTNQTYHPLKKPEDLELKFHFDDEGNVIAPKNLKAKVNQKIYFTQTDNEVWGTMKIFIERLNPEKGDYSTMSLLVYTFRKKGRYKIEFFIGNKTNSYTYVTVE